MKKSKRTETKPSALDLLMSRRQEDEKERDENRNYFQWDDFDTESGNFIIFPLAGLEFTEQRPKGASWSFLGMNVTEAYLVGPDEEVIRGGKDMRLPCNNSQHEKSLGGRVKAAIKAGDVTGIISDHETYTVKNGNPEEKKDQRHLSTFVSSSEDLISEYREKYDG